LGFEKKGGGGEGGCFGVNQIGNRGNWGKGLCPRDVLVGVGGLWGGSRVVFVGSPTNKRKFFGESGGVGVGCVPIKGWLGFLDVGDQSSER